MLQMKCAVVLKLLASRDGYLEVLTEHEDGERSVAVWLGSTNTSSKPEVGNHVLLNITGRTLRLGTGGIDFIVAFHSERNQLTQKGIDYAPNQYGHIMKMRYSPWQQSVDSAEEQNSPYHHVFLDGQLNLEGAIVILGELHSMLPAICLRIKEMEPQAKIVYIMPDHTSLFLNFSKHAHHLKQGGWLDHTITSGHAVGGDLECVNTATAMLVAKHIYQADYIICIPGPGGVGTGTPLGHTSLQVAEVIHHVTILQGTPIYVPRIAFHDHRNRHIGLSHHSVTLLTRFVLCPVLVPIPIFQNEYDALLEKQMKEHQIAKRHVVMKETVEDELKLTRLYATFPVPLRTMETEWQRALEAFQTVDITVKAAYRIRQLTESYYYL
ncbi:DUF3866 family protein [Brevibacillus daliensis]|uniref:DUF3866 family protein n=1 Tax=Brevibacillus daliensis TaxID=2892995 RepID=UPI001E597B15|nr:DUF3866 family protein [Brevibacillus daliensis]